MWKVYCDQYLLYSPTLDEYKIEEPTLEMELNKTNSFTFTIYPNHPNYDKLSKLKSIITVYQGNELYFRGRILNDSLGFYNEKQVFCEGELAFLLDSIQRPFNFPETDTSVATVEEYLTFLITRHNLEVETVKQFQIGTVTVIDSNNYIARSDSEYSTTWQLINEGLLGTHGGYLWIDSDEEDRRRINYYADFDDVLNQPVEFGKNLLGITRERRGEDVATAILPLGAKAEDETDPVTIADLEDEDTLDICKQDDYIFSKAAERLYGGRIMRVVRWEDVTQATNLLTKAKAELLQKITIPQTIDFSAADLSAADVDFDGFKLGVYISAKSIHHSLTGNYLVKKITFKLDAPSQNSLVVGTTTTSYTEQAKQVQQQTVQKAQSGVAEKQKETVIQVEETTNSAIERNSQYLELAMKEKFYTKEEINQLLNNQLLARQQAETVINNTVNNLQVRETTNQTVTDAQINQFKKYFRVEDGNIILGEVGKEFILQVKNDKICILQSNVEIGYFKDRKIYLTNGEFVNLLKIGNFAFVPEAGGSMSFKKVVG